MALSTDPWDATELVAYINEVWPGIVDEEYFAKPVAANFFRDFTQYAQSGGDIFHIPDAFTNAFSVQTQSTQATEVTTNAPATTDNTLTINNHVYVATLLGDKDMKQIASSYDISKIYNQKAVGSLVEDLEGDLLALWSSVTTNNIGDTATVLTDSEIRRAIEKLASGDVPLDETAFFFHPYTYWIQVIGIQKYYDASQFGSASVNMTGTLGGGSLNAAERSALRGHLFGIPVFTSSVVTNTLLTVRNLLVHKDAFTYATQTPGGSKIRIQSANWLANLGVLVVWDMINGVTANRETAAVRLNGSNAFILS